MGAESLRLGTGLAYALLAYFGHARPPDARLMHAARAIGPVRAAGLTLACAGHRKTGEGLLIIGSGASVAIAANAGSRSRRADREARPKQPR